MTSDKNPSEKPVSNDPMHGVTLEKMVTVLVDYYGWVKLGEKIRINSFNTDPSIPSSLKFLRKTPWAREKVERLYKFLVMKKLKPKNKVVDS